MPQQLRALAILEEDSGLVPSTHIVAKVHNSNSRESNTFFWPTQVQGIHMVHMDTCTQTLNRQGRYGARL